MLRRVRMVIQGLCLAGFLLLLTLTRYDGQDEIAYPVRLFLDIDPLIMLGSLLSSHTVPVAFLLSLATLLLTLVVGRAFCSWICPLGALNQLAGHLVRRRAVKERAAHSYKPIQRFKYAVLIGLLVASAFGLQWVGLLDPISLSIRSFGLAIGPAVELSLRAVFDAAYHTDIGPLVAVSEPLYNLSRETVLSFEQPAFRQAPLLGALLITILLTNLWIPRLWCRVLCPLGALLGVFSRFSALGLKHTGSCDNCGLCSKRCHGGADPDRAADGQWRPAECYTCGNCTAACEKGLKWRFGVPRIPLRDTSTAGVDLDRRTAISGVVAGAVAVPLVKVPLIRHLPEPLLIRPPGSRPEQDFLSRCVRCGECMKVCLTGGLQPTGLEAGLEGIWTPVLVPRIGYCEYSCTLCGQVCPTSAIEELSVEDKRQVTIGTAFVDPSRCLPLAFGTDCIVCEEHCPTSPKAIQRVEVEVPTVDGGKRWVGRPMVDPTLCIGCGICEKVCPVRDIPAIRVTSIGEDRDPDNPLILESSSPYG